MSPALAAPPVSVPPATRWPPRRGWSDPGTDQPPLPWISDHPAGSPVIPAGAVQYPAMPSGRVRMVTTGTDWSSDPSAGLPPPAPVCLRLTLAILEVRQGTRPVRQLQPWFSQHALAMVGFDSGSRTQRAPMTLCSLHVQRPSPAAVEGVAVYRVRDRQEAMALRLEARGRQWFCTACETRPGGYHN